MDPLAVVPHTHHVDRTDFDGNTPFGLAHGLTIAMIASVLARTCAIAPTIAT